MPLEQDLLGTPSLLAAVRAAAASWRSGILAERSKQALSRVRDRVNPTPTPTPTPTPNPSPTPNPNPNRNLTPDPDPNPNPNPNQALKHEEARRLRDELGPTSAEVTRTRTRTLTSSQTVNLALTPN